MRNSFLKEMRKINQEKERITYLHNKRKRNSKLKKLFVSTFEIFQTMQELDNDCEYSVETNYNKMSIFRRKLRKIVIFGHSFYAHDLIAQVILEKDKIIVKNYRDVSSETYKFCTDYNIKKQTIKNTIKHENTFKITNKSIFKNNKSILLELINHLDRDLEKSINDNAI